MPESPENEHCEQTPAPDGGHKTNNARAGLFNLGAMTWGQRTLRRIQEYDYKRKANRCKKYSYVWSKAAWRRTSTCWENRQTKLAIFFAFAVAFLGAWYSERLESNGVIAIFTIVMAYTTWRNWEAMRVQNEIMISQMKQSDAIISHMRNERRPWLSIVKPEIDFWSGEQSWVFTYKAMNHGKTPATITEFYFGVLIEPVFDSTASRVADCIERETSIGDVVSVIAPSRDAAVTHSFRTRPAQAEAMRAFFDGDAKMICGIRLEYISTNGDRHATAGMYAFQKGTIGWVPMNIGGPEHNYMR